MRLLWTFLALVILGGAWALWNTTRTGGMGALPESPPHGAERLAASLAAEEDAARRSRGARGEQGSGTTGLELDAAPGPRHDDRAALAESLLASSAERAAQAAPPDAERTEVPEDAPRLTDGLDAAIPGVTILPGTIVRMPDGTIRADDRFTIRGAGTSGDPFRVTWELLVSAGEVYQPRLGKLELPQRVALLHGKHVRIDGYAAFPIFSFDPKEMLAMLNQWDGCCIGVPPTPYDAIEVKLATAPRDRRRQLSYFGTTTGKLSVEPYLVENWLVGLYLMDDAAFTMDM
ncbi:MAG TPA: hypothetical protein PKC43_05070 [Phycisphaerales bacterium]|nr:hypothetical protein [Phycisphaerales bacterium]HMP36801.1 hypothetical protein [Phycisphaerales bacterium]